MSGRVDSSLRGRVVSVLSKSTGQETLLKPRKQTVVRIVNALSKVLPSEHPFEKELFDWLSEWDTQGDNDKQQMGEKVYKYRTELKKSNKSALFGNHHSYSFVSDGKRTFGYNPKTQQMCSFPGEFFASFRNTVVVKLTMDDDRVFFQHYSTTGKAYSKPMFKRKIRIKIGKNGDKYIGELSHKDYSSFRNGKGLHLGSDGGKYIGGWRDDTLNGYGEYLYPNGNLYRGKWKHGKRHGEGRIEWPNGNSFEGKWDNDRMREGEIRYANGSNYEGPFQNDRPHGMGVLRKRNGDVVTGLFQRGLLHGTGVCMFVNDDTYFGNFVNTVFCGKGALTLNGVGVYRGNFLNGVPDGNMTWKSIHGGEQKGSMKNGKWMGERVSQCKIVPKPVKQDGLKDAGEREGEGEGEGRGA